MTTMIAERTIAVPIPLQPIVSRAIAAFTAGNLGTILRVELARDERAIQNREDVLTPEDFGAIARKAAHFGLIALGEVGCG